MSEQLSLLAWKPPAEVLPFPSHRSHGATAGVAKRIMALETPKRTGHLNSLRAKTRKRMAPFFGQEAAEKIADDLIKMIRMQIAFRESFNPPSKQHKTEAVIFSLKRPGRESVPHCEGVGEAGAWGQGIKSPVGFGAKPHETEGTEYDAARA